MMSSSTTPATRRLTYYIKAAEVVQRGLTEPRLRAIGISYGQLTALMMASRLPGISGAELARQLGHTAQANSEVVGALIRKGLIERNPAIGDRKTLRLDVSAEGRSMLERAEAELDSVEHELLEGLPFELITAAREALVLVAENGRRSQGQGDSD